jgi:predicted acetyltransferase
VPAALGARRYEMSDRITVEVVDPLLPDVAGRYELDGGPDGAHCAKTGGAPDLVLDVSALSSVYAGGVGVTALAAAGRVEERRPGAVFAADRLFRTSRPPFCPTYF